MRSRSPDRPAGGGGGRPPPRNPDQARDRMPRERTGGGPRPRGPENHGGDRRRGEEAAVPRPGALSLNAPRPAPAGPERRSGPAAPRNSVWLYGLHPVQAALGNPARRLKRLLLTEEAEAELSALVPPPWPLSAERTDRGRLDQLLGRDAVHQGMALLADLLPPPGLAAALDRPGPVLVLDQVTDPRNVGAMLRTAAAFGVAGVITQDRNSPEETGAMAKAASGALERIPLVRAINLARTLAALKAAGLWVVGLDAGGAALRGDGLRARRVALVLGAEGSGLRRLTRETCDELAGLPMPGGMESLNVSAAAAVALYELIRA